MRTSLLLVPALVLALAGCAPAVALEPADDAIDPACARVVVALPETVAGLDSRETNAQGTGAWGDPATVLLRCGVPSPDPTSSECLLVDGIDWIRDGSKDPNFAFTTYGRTPATEVVIDSTKASGGDVLPLLSEAVEEIPATDACVGAEDVG